MADEGIPVDQTHLGTDIPDSEPAHDEVLDLSTMAQYVVLGIDSQGHYQQVISPNMSVSDLGRYVGQLTTTLLIQAATMGALQAGQIVQQQRQRSPIVTPGNFRST